MLARLVYYKNKLSTDNKICLENRVNLSKQKKNRKDNENKVELFYNLQDENDSTLLFESRFESGNLLAAFCIDDNDYQLVLQKDTNSNGYHQWFFFQISNTRKSNTVKISIINLVRKRSKYSKGIKLWTYSTLKSTHEGIGWHHNNYETTYIKNGLYYYSKGKKKYYSTLTFNYTFEYNDDKVYFANCIPYTYSDLMKDLAEYQLAEDSKYPFFHRKTLCKTLGGNDLDYITINSTKKTMNNSKSNSWSNRPNDEINNCQEAKEAVVLIARQHPSECPGSWVMKGAIEFLLSNCEEANFLREHFVFKIIPMMNPDGVIEGNTRTSFAGCDLNRRWSNPSEMYHPEIYYSKEMISKLALQRNIQCFVDFHGHFGAFNSFFYCNNQPEEDDLNYKAFPCITALNSGKINYSQSTFKMEKFKKSTCRISLYHDININNIVTLETSNFGLVFGKYANCYLDVSLLKEIGRDVCMGILMYKYHSMHKFNNEIRVSLSNDLLLKTHRIINEAKKTIIDTKLKVKQEEVRQVVDENMKEKENEKEKVTTKKDNYDDSDKESESEPSEDNLSLDEIKKLITVTRKHYKKRVKRHIKTKLSPVGYKTNIHKIAISQTTNADSNSYISNNPRKILTNCASILKPIDKAPIQLNCNCNSKGKKDQEISSYSKRNFTNEKHHKPLSIQIIDSSSSGKLLTKEETSGALLPSFASINDTREKESSVNAMILSIVKVDSETQTEEIYFNIHWSYFIGSCAILSEKKILEPNHISNKDINFMVDNKSFSNIYLRKCVYFQKKRLMTQREQNVKTNTDKVKDQRFIERKKETNLYSLHEGTFVVKNLSNINEIQFPKGVETRRHYYSHVRVNKNTKRIELFNK